MKLKRTDTNKLFQDGMALLKASLDVEAVAKKEELRTFVDESIAGLTHSQIVDLVVAWSEAGMEID